MTDSTKLTRMKALQTITALTLLSFATSIAAPGDRIDPRDLKDKVSVKLGTKGTIQVKQQGDALTEPKLVKGPEGGKPGIGVEFTKRDELIMLRVQNRFPKALRYRAAARQKGQREYVETSIIPVMAGLLSFESWQDPIDELILFDFKLTDEKP